MTGSGLQKCGRYNATCQVLAWHTPTRTAHNHTTSGRHVELLNMSQLKKIITLQLQRLDYQSALPAIGLLSWHS